MVYIEPLILHFRVLAAMLFEPHHEKPSSLENLSSGLPDQVRHKPGCTTSDNGLRLEILDLGSRVIALSM